MRETAAVGLFVLMVLIGTGVSMAQVYDPDSFTVCPEQNCYRACPSGDRSFCFCISYKGEPLMASPSDVVLKIECQEFEFNVCGGESWEKSSYLVHDYCFSVQDCGREYCWAFRLWGCCRNATIKLHMIDDTESFYEIDNIVIKTFDVNGDWNADETDRQIIIDHMGMTGYPCLDMNCDGIIDDFDLWWSDFITNHLGHSCDQWIGTDNRSWGAIKSIYRN